MSPPSVSGLTFNLPHAWGNGTATAAASTGLPYTNLDNYTTSCNSGALLYGLPHTEVVPGSVTNTGCRLRTYVYKVWQIYQYVPGVCYESYFVGYFPASPSNVQFAATVLGIPSQPKFAGNESTESQTPSPIPVAFYIEQNYPNPFNPETGIRFGVPEDGPVELTIYSVNGQKVITLVNGFLKRGQHEVVWDGRDESGTWVSSGLYIYELRTGAQKIVKKMVMAK